MAKTKVVKPIRSIKAYAIVKNGRLSTYEIYDTDDMVLVSGEKIIRVIITPYDTRR